MKRTLKVIFQLRDFFIGLNLKFCQVWLVTFYCCTGIYLHVCACCGCIANMCLLQEFCNICNTHIGFKHKFQFTLNWLFFCLIVGATLQWIAEPTVNFSSSKQRTRPVNGFTFCLCPNIFQVTTIRKTNNNNPQFIV